MQVLVEFTENQVHHEKPPPLVGAIQKLPLLETIFAVDEYMHTIFTHI